MPISPQSTPVRLGQYRWHRDCYRDATAARFPTPPGVRRAAHPGRALCHFRPRSVASSCHRAAVEHAPTYTQVPPADSIGRHLCEVACSCGLFHMTASSAQAAAACADAQHAFEGHRERASHAAPVAACARRAGPSRCSGAAAVERAGGRRTSRGRAVAVVAWASCWPCSSRPGRPGVRRRPTLVGGPDRTGPAVLDPGDAEPSLRRRPDDPRGRVRRAAGRGSPFRLLDGARDRPRQRAGLPAARGGPLVRAPTPPWWPSRRRSTAEGSTRIG